MNQRQFGPYRLVRQVAVGGMAEIFLAKTQGIAGFEKYVALKMIHPNFSQDEQFIQMLIDEAKLSVQLQHVNIAQTFDLGRVDDTYYITMEFVEGNDLYKLLRTGAEKDLDVPFAVAAYVAKEVAVGLDYAHRKRDISGRSLGIVHRDISPQNVLVSDSGEVKVVDFGIAKATMRAQQTQAGVIKGKYYYMSPEQASGGFLDHRTDVFSSGILLYEMITGQMLYLEEDLHTLLDMVRRADIASPRTLRPDCPIQLERIVMRALQRLPEDRYASSGKFASDLERYLHANAPIFTATKVAKWAEGVIGEKLTPSAPADDFKSGTMSGRRKAITREQLVLTREDFADENSIIYELGASTAEVESGDASFRHPDEPTPLSTLASDDFFGSDDKTIVSEPPGFESPPDFGLADSASHSPGGMSEEALWAALDADLAGVAAEDLDTDEETRMDAAFKSPDPDSAPKRSSDFIFDSAHAGEQAPALDAGNPRPSVSALYPPRESRRTPAEGLATRPGQEDDHEGQGASLSQLLDSPSRMPRVQISAPLHRHDLDVEQISQPRFNERRPSTGARLDELEVDAIPEAYRIQRSNRGVWLWGGISALVIAALIGAYLLASRQEPAVGDRHTTIEIVSSPEGARISIDEQPMQKKTPAKFSGAEIEATYLISVDLDGYQRWEREYTVRETFPRVIARLERMRVQLKVTSVPDDAEVFLNQKSMGRTPLSLENLLPEQAESVELRKKGFRPVTRRLDWSSETSKDIDMKLSP